ncbi:type II toxin-antitoxin system VapB family antitoxin [Streptomyces sp. A7024]|uniref:Type II toxin-antitoxin system VapB family antitoxin n=1 Tax=Streptomyces coryli TaxID=1128680 RepID=A0A6G4TXF8_9ACTN|nr:type II toxin-antitoxin system VapB family antitoxin [Streptomyces coryli]NGN63691.1 type II toxin-antitoxin system VapB family antitoxin [Streptomyces coryli]
MTKMLIDIDEEALAKAQAAFGTKTKKDTVNRALAEVTERLDRAAALRELQRLAVEEGALDLDMLGDKTRYRPSSDPGQDVA